MKHKLLQLVENVQDLKGVKFASFTYLSKGTKELARHTVILGFSYNTLVEKSLIELEVILPTLTSPLQKEAGEAIKKSLEKTLAAHAIGEQNEDYTKKGMYEPIGNGLNINKNDNTLQLFGLVQSKVTIVEGEYKEVNSRPLTLAKKEITKVLSMSKFREFALDLETVASAKINGETIEFVSNLEMFKDVEVKLEPASVVIDLKTKTVETVS